MSVQVTYGSKLTVAETLPGGDLASNARTVTHNGNDTAGAFNAGSTPPVSQIAAFSIPMVNGAATINLRALLGTNAAAVDGNGLKAQFVKFINPGTNANPITISKGAANGYDGFGADFSITLGPGGELLLKLNSYGDVISDGNKTLDLDGTGTQALTMELVNG
jgi:hypothetical protein